MSAIKTSENTKGEGDLETNAIQEMFPEELFSFYPVWFDGKKEERLTGWIHSSALAFSEENRKQFEAIQEKIDNEKTDGTNGYEFKLGDIYASNEENTAPLILVRDACDEGEINKLFRLLMRDDFQGLPSHDNKLSERIFNFPPTSDDEYASASVNFRDRVLKSFECDMDSEKFSANNIQKLFNNVTSKFFDFKCPLNGKCMVNASGEPPCHAILAAIVALPITVTFESDSGESSQKNIGVILAFFWTAKSKWSPTADSAKLLYTLFLYARAAAETKAIGELSRQQRKSAARAARAAVLARNFSHIIGSHVLSNPDFADRLIPGKSDWKEAYQALLHRAMSAPTDLSTWQPKIREGKARTIFEETGRTKSAIQQFHAYLQGRFDFIARAVESQRDHPEPLFFVADVLEGFLSQVAFLDTVASDVGLSLRDMRVVLHLPNPRWSQDEGNTPEFLDFLGVWNSDKEFKWEKRDSDDVRLPYDLSTLVGLPGGMIAVHGFYALLENIIRNSAKYGSDREDGKGGLGKYVLNLKIKNVKDPMKSKPSRYELRIWDSFSGMGEGNEFHHKVGALMDGELMNKTGGLKREALGFREMEICADNLWHDEEVLDYTAKKKSLRLAEISDSEEWPLRNGETSGDQESRPRLTFTLDLARPVLLGLISYIQESQIPYIGTFGVDESSMRELSSSGAHLAIVNGSLTKQVNKLVSLLASTHKTLPYRLLILCRNDREEGKWRKELNDNQLIPPLRVQVYSDENLANRIASIDAENFSDPIKSSDLTESESIIISCYAAWLQAWKPSRKTPKWHLWIGFQRANEQVQNSWESVLAKFQSQIIQIAVCSKNEKEKPSACFTSKGAENLADSLRDPKYWKDEADFFHCNKRALVFDNHGACFPESYSVNEDNPTLESWCRFYQRFGSDNIDFHRIMEHPPTSAFGFSWFIHSLVESCLAEVAVVDERLVADLLFLDGETDSKDTASFKKDLGLIQRSGVWPIFTFKQDRERFRGHFTIRHKQRALEVVSGTAIMKAKSKSIAEAGEKEALEKRIQRHERGAKAIFQEEGLFFGEDARLQFLTTSSENEFRVTPGRCTNQLVKCSEIADPPKGGPGCNAISPDVIVIHEGTLDLIHNHREVNWASGDEKDKERWKHIERLWRIAPSVVRTSGRGRGTNHLPRELPFIEFSEVSGALLTSRNKYSLVRGLFGATGEPRNNT